jgi:UDP-N-acetylmuramate: L-alanyl-gamma-D-glutamyl-meso-diaminopimelate ligase
MLLADEALVYFNPHTIAHKKLEPISEQEVKSAFGTDNVQVYTDAKKLVAYLKAMDWNDTNLLLMTSGNFDGVDFAALAHELIGHQ